MASIIERVYADGNDRAITLANEEYVRPIHIGSGWSHVRIGMLCDCTPDGTNNLTSTSLIVGLCSGTAAPYGAASTTNFIGASMMNQLNVLGTFTYNAGSGNPYFSSQGQGPITKVGASVSLTLGNGSPCVFATTDGALQRKTLVMVSISRGAPNYTVTRFLVPAANANLNYRLEDLYMGMEQSSVAAVSVGAVSLAVISQAAAFDEIAGAVNAVNIFWNRSGQPLEIFALMVYRYS